MAQTKVRKLTPRQREIYEFLKDKILNRGYGPTVREIGARFGIRSPNGVMCHLKALEKKGLIIRESHMSRAIQLVEWPPDRKWGVRFVGDLSASGVKASGRGEERLDFSDVGNDENLDCYRMKDNSLSDEHIVAGDFVLVRKADSYTSGTLVLVRKRGKRPTLARYFVEEGEIRLEYPGKKGTDTATKNDVLGELVGVIRRY
ncbi:MAG TPA: repressor LexA [Planctomycetaceae bacterium]|nr:repressor LexA [Planctomycetaceae bacterium]